MLGLHSLMQNSIKYGSQGHGSSKFCRRFSILSSTLFLCFSTPEFRCLNWLLVDLTLNQTCPFLGVWYAIYKSPGETHDITLKQYFSQTNQYYLQIPTHVSGMLLLQVWNSFQINEMIQDPESGFGFHNGLVFKEPSMITLWVFFHWLVSQLS